MHIICKVAALATIAAVEVSSTRAATAEAVSCYKYEPAIVTLKGTLSVRTEFGPPGYGESPKSDSKEQILVLTLVTPICVAGDPASETNSESEYAIRELQTGPGLKLDPSILDKYIGRTIVATGTLFHAENAHHRTNVLFTIDSIH